MLNTLVLNSKRAKLSFEHLLSQLGNGGVEVRDAHGKIVAVVLGTSDKEAITYAEAHIYLDEHNDQVRQALGRRGGIATAQLLEKAAAAADEAAQQ